MAILNVTIYGESKDLCELDIDTPDEDVRRIATEAMGLSPNTFADFAVDKFTQQDRMYLRPKVPFGGN